MTASPSTREKRPTAMRGLLFLLVLAVVAAVLFVATLALRSEEGPKVPSAEQVPEPISVVVIEASVQAEFDLEETFTGLITARRTSELGFNGGGRIDRLSADVGDQVDAGALLARLDTRSLSARLAATQASIDEAEASRELALTTLERQRQLRDEGHVSQQVVDEFVAQASRAEAQLSATKAQAETLRVEIDLARLRAPFAGVITQRYADEGVIAAPGMPIFELVESAALEARIGVPSVVASSLVVGGQYDLDVGDDRVPAVLRAVTGVIDARQRTVSVVFDLDGAETAFPGAVARLPMDRQVDERGAWVPVTALTESTRGLWSVLVAEPDGSSHLAAPRIVEIVHTEGTRVFVRGALSGGDLVIADGLQRITPRQAVTPRRMPLETAKQDDAASPY
ncbi:MAG: efflux RND transporter periplasmic adaptor subunit [Pseudomonadota bacterium]